MDEAAVRLVKLLSSHEKLKQKLADQQATVTELESQLNEYGGANMGRAVYECHTICTQLDALNEAYNFYAIKIPVQQLIGLSNLKKYPWVDQSNETWATWDSLTAYAQRDDVRYNLSEVWREICIIDVSSVGLQPDRYTQYIESCALDLKRCRYDLWQRAVDNIGTAVTAAEVQLGEAYERLQTFSASDQRKRVATDLQATNQLVTKSVAEIEAQTKQIAILKKSLGLPDQL